MEARDLVLGIISIKDRRVNGLADTLAGKGSNTYPWNMAKFSIVCAFRAQILATIVHSIHTHIIKVFAWDKEDRRIRSFVQGGSSDSVGDAVLPPTRPSRAPSLPPNPISPAPRQLNLRIPPLVLMGHAPDAFKQVWVFLKNLLFQSLTEESATPHLPAQGTSWIELLCAFEILGGRLPESGPATNKAHPARSLRLALVFFRRLVLQVADICLSAGDRSFLSPSKSPIRRLQHVGYTNFVPCIRALVTFDQTTQGILVFALLALRIPLSRANKHVFQSGALRVKDVKLSYRGVPAGRKLAPVSDVIRSLTDS